MTVSGLAAGVADVAAGGSFTCVLMDAANGAGVRCWGRNDYGQLGDGATTGSSTPVGVSGLEGGVAAVAAGGSHACALTNAGGVLCLGVNSSGQLGDGTVTNRRTPVAVSGLASGVAAVAAGGYHTCAVMTSGAAQCWGDGSYGQLGDGATTGSFTPVPVTGLSAGVAALAPGAQHTCALMGDGEVQCWGRNVYGQLGDGTTTDRSSPVAAGGLPAGAAQSWRRAAGTRVRSRTPPRAG